MPKPHGLSVSVVQGGVGGLGNGHLVDAVARRGRHDRQQFGEAGAHAGAEHRRTAGPARLEDALAALAEVVAGDKRCRGDDIHAGRQDADQLVDVVPHRVVDHAVGFERQQRVDVVGRGDAERLDPDELTDVAAGLVRRPGVAADELEGGVGGYGLDRALADVAGRPLDDPIWGVGHSLSIGTSRR
jgi:hypothetical protein